MAEYARTVSPDLEVAMINAAVLLTETATGKVADDVEKNYRRFYKAIVESYQEVYPQMTSEAKRA